MKQKAGLFAAVATNDREGLMGKAVSSITWLKIMAIINIVISALIMIATSYGVSLSRSIPTTGPEASMSVGILMGSFVISLLFIVFIFWYLGRIKADLENNVVPNLVPAYIMIAFGIIGFLSILFARKDLLNIVSILTASFNLFLWYTLISSVNKIKYLSNLS